MLKEYKKRQSINLTMVIWFDVHCGKHMPTWNVLKKIYSSYKVTMYKVQAALIICRFLSVNSVIRLSKLVKNDNFLDKNGLFICKFRIRGPIWCFVYTANNKGNLYNIACATKAFLGMKNIIRSKAIFLFRFKRMLPQIPRQCHFLKRPIFRPFGSKKIISYFKNVVVVVGVVVKKYSRPYTTILLSEIKTNTVIPFF